MPRQIDAHSRSLGHVPLIAPNGVATAIPPPQSSLRCYDKRRKDPTDSTAKGSHSRLPRSSALLHPCARSQQDHRAFDVASSRSLSINYSNSPVSSPPFLRPPAPDTAPSRRAHVFSLTANKAPPHANRRQHYLSRSVKTLADYFSRLCKSVTNPYNLPPQPLTVKFFVLSSFWPLLVLPSGRFSP